MVFEKQQKEILIAAKWGMQKILFNVRNLPTSHDEVNIF